MHAKNRPLVLANFEPAGHAGMEIFRGILQYEQFRASWNFQLLLYSFQGINEIDYREISGYVGEENIKLTNRLFAEGVPCVLIDPSPDYIESLPRSSRHCVVEIDGTAVGINAAQYFLERNFVKFGYVNARDSINEKNNRYWSSRRQSGFVEELNRHGKECLVYTPRHADWKMEQADLEKWLCELPRPIALLVAWDGRATQVIQLCTKNKIEVPTEVAILGVDDDELLCNTTSPPLSSIKMDTRKAGWQAGEYLDAMMKNKVRKPRFFQYKPVAIISRQSTNQLCFNDELVNEALRLIWDVNGCNITVDDVVRSLIVSKRHLENRVKATLGHSLIEEILRIRTRYVCSLLRDTHNSLNDVAEIAGFSSQAYLAQFFKKQLGMTMRQYRKTTISVNHRDYA